MPGSPLRAQEGFSDIQLFFFPAERVLINLIPRRVTQQNTFNLCDSCAGPEGMCHKDPEKNKARAAGLAP
jgi:hypothetical protein